MIAKRAAAAHSFWMFLALPAFLLIAGCGSSNSSSDKATAAPTLSPGGGSYNTSQTVTVSDTTSGAVLYCTTDGTTPTASSPPCAQPTTIFKTEFLQAIAVAPGRNASAIASAAYTIDLTAAATPTFSPAGGTYTSTQTVSIADTTAGANIFYTLDGSVPTSASALYTGSVAVSATETLSAVAAASGYNNSGVASATYVINPTVAAPVFSVVAGTYSTVQSVGISDATSGATIYYTLDGTTPTTASAAYSSPITISQTSTLNAIAAAPGLTNSPVVSASYVIMLAAAPAPAFTPVAGTYTSVQSVAITDAVAGAAIYYTTDGSTPTASSTLYSGLLSVGSTETLQAIAIAAGYTPSPVASAAYTINLSTAPPVISPAGGSFTSVQTVTIADLTPAAVIYYTIDGSAPTTSSMPYTGPVSIGETETLKAIAAAPGYNASTVASAAFSIDLGGTAAPTFSVAAGTFSSPQTVSISDTTAGATIYYTIDGSAPTASSQVYSSPLAVGSTETLQAIATAPGFTTSLVTSAVYTISLGNASLSGTVLSGTTPINGAQVQLYAASTAGYGSAGTALLSMPVTTTSTGAFSFRYTCPASPSQANLIYLVATGGDAGNGPSTAIELMAALGPCGNLTGTPSVVVNEATTVASAYALAPFMTTAPDVGASSSNYQGLSNAFATVGNLVNLTTGAVLSITPAYATNTVPYLNSSTVPTARINTLADVLNACVSTSGPGSSGCSSLFGATNPAAPGTPPSDTLQAILNVAQNPGANASTLFGLASTTGPFQPELPAAPNDWTLALTFTGGGLGISPTQNATVTIGGNQYSGVEIVNTALAIDALGDVWVGGYVETSPLSFPYLGDSVEVLLAEFSPVGAPLSPSTTLTPAMVATVGGYNPQLPSQTPPLPGTAPLLVMAFDQTTPAPGNLWLGDYSNGDVVETNLNFLQAGSAPSVSMTGAINGGTTSLAIDGSSNVWAGGEYLGEFTSNGTVVLAPSSVPSPATSVSQLLFDSSGSLWAPGTSFAGPDVFEFGPPQSGAVSLAFDAFPQSNFPSGGSSTTLVADGSGSRAGNVYGCGEPGGQTLDVFKGSAAPATYTISTTRGCGNQLVLDGLGNIFAVLNSQGFPAGAVIDEFTTVGAQPSGSIVTISPANGYTGTSSAETPTLNPDSNVAGPVPGPSAAIDGSGNLWVLNNDTNGPLDASSVNIPGNVLVEFIGIAAPAVTPTSVALKTGQMGARP